LAGTSLEQLSRFAKTEIHDKNLKMNKMIFMHWRQTFANDMVATYISMKLNNISGSVER